MEIGETIFLCIKYNSRNHETFASVVIRGKFCKNRARWCFCQKQTNKQTKKTAQHDDLLLGNILTMPHNL